MTSAWNPPREAWLVDAVVAAMLTQEDLISLAGKAEHITPSETRVDFRFDLPGRSGGLDSLLTRIDRRNGINRLGTAAMPIGEGVSYRSVDDRLVSHVGMGSDDDGTTRVTFEAGLTVKGKVPPETVMAALPGRHATAIVAHPALDVPGLDIIAVSYNGTLAQGGRPAEWTGFFVKLPSLHVQLRRG